MWFTGIDQQDTIFVKESMVKLCGQSSVRNARAFIFYGGNAPPKVRDV
jgi:hypothetical protein